MAKRSLCLLLALVSLFSLAAPALAEEEPVVAEEPVEVTEEAVEEEEVTEEPAAEPETAAVMSGTCGENVQWSFVDGALTISGTGKMTDYTAGYLEGPAPWYKLASQVTTASIGNGVTAIGNNAFFGCGNMTSVSIPNSVTSIGEWAFNDCRSLTDLKLPNSLTVIGNSAFQGCDSLGSVTIPAGVTDLGDSWTFNARITDIHVASGNKNYASVDGVLFNAGKTELICYPQGKTAASYAVPNTVKTIGDAAFANCKSLTSVTIPSGVTSIGANAFDSCGNLTSVTIPASVTSIGDSAFSQTPWLEAQGDLVIVNGILLQYQGSAASVTIPGTVKSIGDSAFWGCRTLTSVTIPASVTSIGSSAFAFCSALTSVTVPNSVTDIWYNAFNGCESLTSLTVQAPNCEIRDAYGGGMTLGVPGTTVVHAHDGSTAERYAKRYGYSFVSLGKQPQLAAPTVKIAQVSGGIKVSWNKITGAPRYMVYYKENGGSWKKIGTTTATSYTRKASALKNGATYQFTVRCCAEDKVTMLGPYKASDSLKYVVDLTAPTVKIVKVSTGIKVSWNKVSGSPRYMVYYKEGNGGWKKIGTTTATSYTRAAKYLKNNVKYTFTVRCCASDKKTLLSTYKASNILTYKK